MGIFDNFSIDQFAGGLASGIQTGTGIAGRRAAGRRADEQGRLANERLRLQQEQFGFQREDRQSAENKKHADILALFQSGEVARDQGATPAQIAATHVGDVGQQQQSILSLLASQDPTAQTQAQLQQQKLQAEILAKQAGAESSRANIGFKQEGLAQQRDAQNLAREKFEFDQNKFQVDQRSKQADLGRLSGEQERFYIGEVNKINKEYDADLERYNSASQSLAASNATGDKAALVHLARMISDEALNESDISRLTSEGVLPSYFESTWNSVLGKGELSQQERLQVQQQIDREIQSKFGRYSTSRNYLGTTFDPRIKEDERRRILGDDRRDPFASDDQQSQSSGRPLTTPSGITFTVRR